MQVEDRGLERGLSSPSAPKYWLSARGPLQGQVQLQETPSCAARRLPASQLPCQCLLKKSPPEGKQEMTGRLGVCWWEPKQRPHFFLKLFVLLGVEPGASGSEEALCPSPAQTQHPPTFVHHFHWASALWTSVSTRSWNSPGLCEAEEKTTSQDAGGPRKLEETIVYISRRALAGVVGCRCFQTH
ncbi:uncharacterized protein LOC101713912 isoform X2 [Heterocephalus glaber]|uniref:Uncharacterized protein LOC101713912 isoform X2 n=1 Tax=Heterocephalus glaber TaxID=10181 RepID=A0AAX6RP60_HETGA|nr:uncharacterized protein LOC101713912 isoform X2 [Heterocephalus glaber]